MCQKGSLPLILVKGAQRKNLLSSILTKPYFACEERQFCDLKAHGRWKSYKASESIMSIWFQKIVSELVFQSYFLNSEHNSSHSRRHLVFYAISTPFSKFLSSLFCSPEEKNGKPDDFFWSLSTKSP